MVWPSGLARATYSVAMLPMAPGLFSTITVRLSSGRIFSANYRTSTSAPLPAGNAQMKCTSWVGYCCARTAAGHSPNASTARAANRLAMCLIAFRLQPKSPLRLEPCNPHVFFPILNILEEPRLAFVGRAAPRVATVTCQKRWGFIVRQDLVEPPVDLIDDRAWGSGRDHGGKPSHQVHRVAEFGHARQIGRGRKSSRGGNREDAQASLARLRQRE